MSKSIVKKIDALSPMIRQIRNTDVVLDFEVAAAYGVPTKALVQAVKRNARRFPADFMFQLSKEEAAVLRSQIVTTKKSDRRGGTQYRPYAFTEQGVAMLSGVLRSPMAIKVNIAIMRSFVQMRKALLSLDDIEEHFKGINPAMSTAFVLIRALMKSSVKPVQPALKAAEK